MDEFEAIPPECTGTVSVTSFRYNGTTYSISTTDITSLHDIQAKYDTRAGYTGKLGNYETMLFIDQESADYPFGDLPGWLKLGIFVRYDTEDEARDGHQEFVTKVQKTLRRMSQDIRPEEAIVEAIPPGLQSLAEKALQDFEAGETEEGGFAL